MPLSLSSVFIETVTCVHLSGAMKEIVSSFHSDEEAGITDFSAILLSF